MTQPVNDMIQFNRKLDAIVSSDEALQSALQSNDPILRAAARLTNNRHPAMSLLARQSISINILSTIKKKSGTPSNLISIKFMAWAGRLAAVFVIAIMASLVAQPVSADSLPGDALYPVKIGFENLQLIFATSPSARVQAHLNHADERLREIQQLTPESALIQDTLNSAINSLNRATTIASDNAVFEQDSRFTEQAITVLMTLEQSLETNQISDEYVVQVQSDLNPIILNLPIGTISNVEDEPEIMSAGIENTPEVPQPVIESSVDVTGAETEQGDTTEEETRYVYAEARVNVRGGAGINFDIVGVATHNMPVTVIGQNEAGDWIEVRLANGTLGWIFNELLADAPNETVGSGNSNVDEPRDTNNSSGNANSNSNGNGNSNGNANGNSNGNSNGNANGNRNSNANGNGN